MSSFSSSPNLTLAHLEALRDVKYHIVVTFTFLIWDLFLTLEAEVEYIWRMKHRAFRWCYFYFRYFLVVAQAIHLAVVPILSSDHTTGLMCMLWYQYAVFLSQVSLFLIDIILATRAFALFNGSRKVAIFLAGLILSEAVCAGIHMATFPAMNYFHVCLLPDPNHDLSHIHPTVTMIVQTIIMGMFVSKRLIGTRPGWGRTPLISFLLKDAMPNYVIVSLICCVTLACWGLDDLRMMVFFYWAISLYSSIGSRLILNMERFASRYPTEEEFELTSNISLY